MPRARCSTARRLLSYRYYTGDLVSALSPQLCTNAAGLLGFFTGVARQSLVLRVDDHHNAVSLDAPEVWVYERHRDREAREGSRSTTPAKRRTAANVVRRDGKRPARDAFQAVSSADLSSLRGRKRKGVLPRFGLRHHVSLVAARHRLGTRLK